MRSQSGSLNQYLQNAAIVPLRQSKQRVRLIERSPARQQGGRFWVFKIVDDEAAFG